ncbi:MAG: hypothetical protein R6U50_13005 [Desulfobacterales bacterium]
MTRKESYREEVVDHFEYHGSTAIEFTRRSYGKTINREWILFDSVEEAVRFFHDNCGDSEN